MVGKTLIPPLGKDCGFKEFTLEARVTKPTYQRRNRSSCQYLPPFESLLAKLKSPAVRIFTNTQKNRDLTLYRTYIKTFGTQFPVTVCSAFAAVEGRADNAVDYLSLDLPLSRISGPDQICGRTPISFCSHPQFQFVEKSALPIINVGATRKIFEPALGGRTMLGFHRCVYSKEG